MVSFLAPLGRPKSFLRFRALFNPSLVLSLIKFLSNSATAPKIYKMNLPFAEVVSNSGSLRLLKLTPNSLNLSIN